MNASHTLSSLGWDDFFEARFADMAARGWTPGRVAIQHKGTYTVLTPVGELRATIAGKLRYHASDAADLPVVGDWVALEVRMSERAATIHRVVERRTKFSRKVAGFESDEQVLAANVDVVFVATSLNADLNPRRLERYLTMAYENGAAPAIVLTKADLCDDVGPALETVDAVALGAPVHVVSAVTGEGFDALRTHLRGDRTVALLGSSGVGKSTLINELAGEPLLEVQEIREDDERGRHTTTHRQMVALPEGGIIIDTPGMRELQLWEAADGVTESFKDISTLAQGCRFRDCTHGHEPGCAVTAAVESGELAAERLSGYHKLQRELLYLERKRDQRLASQETRKWKIRHKAMRKANSPKV